MYEIFEIPEIAKEDIAWQNDLLGRRRMLRADIGPLEAAIRVDSAVDVKMHSRSLILQSGDHQWSVQVLDWDSLPFVEAILNGGSLSSLPDEIALAVLDATFSDSLDALGQRIGAKVELAGFADTEVPQTWHSVSLRIDCGSDSSLAARISGTQQSIRLLHELVKKSSVVEAAIDVETLSVQARIVIGRSWLTIDELRSLNVHDVAILEESSYLAQQAAMMIVPGYRQWQVRVGVNELIVSEVADGVEATASRFSPSVHISFEFRRVRFCVNQLRQLTPETSIPYESLELVTLCSHGRPFGAGELVEVGGKLGVRITDLSQEIVHEVLEIDDMQVRRVPAVESISETAPSEEQLDVQESV